MEMTIQKTMIHNMPAGVTAQEAQWLLSEKYAGVESDAFRADLERLKKGEPLAYVIGFSTFMGCTIDLSFKPLIPRTETEYWVEKAINEIQDTFGAEKKIHCLDVFSGSGCIGIAVLSRLSNATMDFAELNDALLSQIRKNIELNEITAERFNIYASDVFSGIPEGTKYDVIFANPPYIAYKDADRIQKSVLDHEPHAALFAEGEGMELIEKTFSEAGKYLMPGGRVYLECDDIQEEKIVSLLEHLRLTTYSLHKDQFGLFRWVSILYP